MHSKLELIILQLVIMQDWIIKDDHSILMRSKDLNKDQTYFLHEVSGQEFAKCIFPLEGLTKFEVRE